MIWDREDYLKEADSQLSDNKNYRDVEYTKNLLCSLVDKSCKKFQSLSKKKYISEKELKYFTYTNENAANFFYLLFTFIYLLLFFYLRFTSVYLMFLGDQSYQTVELLPKKFQNT